MISSHKRFIVLIAGLLLIAGQVATLAHAAEHPFHAPDDTCAAFTSFEHNNHAVAVLPQGIASPDITDKTDIRFSRIFINQTRLCHRPRSPPLHT